MARCGHGRWHPAQRPPRAAGQAPHGCPSCQACTCQPGLVSDLSVSRDMPHRRLTQIARPGARIFELRFPEEKHRNMFFWAQVCGMARPSSALLSLWCQARCLPCFSRGACAGCRPHRRPCGPALLAVARDALLAKNKPMHPLTAQQPPLTAWAPHPLPAHIPRRWMHRQMTTTLLPSAWP